MRSTLAIGAVLMMLVAPARADDAAIKDAAGKLASAVFANMAAGYMCREALGGLAQYQAAVTIAEGTLELMGYSTDDAVLTVDDMSKKFESDPRAAKPDVDASACVDQVNDRLQDIKVWTAKYRKAAGLPSD